MLIMTHDNFNDMLFEVIFFFKFKDDECYELILELHV